MTTQTILDEELTTDSDFGDLFPPKEEIAPSDLDEIKTVIEEESSLPTTEKKDEPVQKKRVGRPPKKPAEVSDVEGEQPKKKPGRPPKKADPEGETKSVEKPAPKEEASSVEKKPRAKRVSVDDLPPETIEHVYEGYSTKPIEELSSEVNLSDKHIQKLMDRLKEIFELEISSGGLAQEDFDKEIAPKFVPFTPKDPLASFVKKKIKTIKK